MKRLKFPSAEQSPLIALSEHCRSLAVSCRLLLSTILLITNLTSCQSISSYQSIRQSIRSFPQKRVNWPPPPGYRDIKGAIHIHSYLSHDSDGRPEEIIDGAITAGLEFIIMTDHYNPLTINEGMAGMHRGILVIQGAEIRKRKLSLLGLGMKRIIQHETLSTQEIVDQLKAEGALVFAAHPAGETEWQTLTGLHGMEIYDIYDDATDHKIRYPGYFFDILFSFKKYPDEVFLSILDRPEKELALWDRKTQGTRLVGIAGNDAHQNIRLFGQQIDPYERSLRFVATHLFVPSLNEASILEALKQGKAYVSFDILADGTGFLFGLRNKEKLWLMGEEIPLQKGMQIVAHAPLSGKAHLIRNGKVIHEIEGREFLFIPEKGGVYRVEWFLRLNERWWPWIFSNPIYLGDWRNS